MKCFLTIQESGLQMVEYGSKDGGKAHDLRALGQADHK